ncbi:MAG: hypothetical protein U9N53_03020 [Bacteroidota bacterium]|nr:hypothetical protein [Bacteroidota bacterium]
MKTQLTLYVIFIILITSCVQKKQGDNMINKKLETIVNADTIGNKEIEMNLKNQLYLYSVAVHEGDPDVAISYIYPDLLVYLKQQYPDDFSITSMKESFREMGRDMERTKEEMGLTYEYKIGKILNRIDLGSDKIYIIENYLIGKTDLEEYSERGVVVAITNDNGQNWTFMEKDPESIPPTLRMKFSEDVVRQIMKIN